MKRDRTQIGTLLGMAAVVILFAALGWHRRWIADDGLIVVRTVRNVLAGNGPVYNAFERAEANTSTLWTYVLVAVIGVIKTEPVMTAIVVGWLLSIAGVVLACDGARRLHRERGSSAMLVPAGALVLLGTQPFWDYATSGLESGLCTFFLGLCWWLLVTLKPGRRAWISAVVFGLGPLVRPDFAIVAVTFCIALWWLVRPRKLVAFAMLATAMLVPVAYEIFRMGYYGVIVPLPAIAKSATHAEWGRGFVYLFDYVRPYFTYVPMVLLLGVFVVTLKQKWLTGRSQVLVATSTVTAFLLAGFVLRVGGDFMHGRMMLPPTFMIVLPAFLLPWNEITRWWIGAMGVWLIVAWVVRCDGKAHATAFRVADERHNYATWTKTEHPTSADVFTAADGYATELIAKELAAGHHRLISEGGLDLVANPAYANVPVFYAVGRLGTGGATVDLQSIVVDVLGLANPLGAHIEVNQPGMTGHEKSLPWSWIRADYVDPATDTQPQDKVSANAIRAARHAMTCGELAELLASVRAPMTKARFWANLKGALKRSRFEVPVDPFEAEAKFCNTTTPFHATASSTYELEGWSTMNAIDGVTTSTPASLGFSSDVAASAWIELVWKRPISIHQVTLYPRSDSSPGAGFPVDFQIQIWDGTKWLDRVIKTAEPNPGAEPRTYGWATPDQTERVRILATKLAPIGDGGPRLQLAEIKAE